MTGNRRQFDISEDPQPDPDHYSAPGAKGQKAIALTYDTDISDAPRITAKGDGHIAEQILQVAFAHGIPVRRDSDLTEILDAIDIDSEIPLEAFAAVAEILNYIYKINRLYGNPKEKNASEDDNISKTNDTEGHY